MLMIYSRYYEQGCACDVKKNKLVIIRIMTEARLTINSLNIINSYLYSTYYI